MKNNKSEIEKKDDFKDLSKEDLIENLRIAIRNISRLEYKINKKMNSKEGFAWQEGFQSGLLKAKDEIINDVLKLLRLRCVCRSAGLSLDIKNYPDGNFYKGAYKEIEEFYRHLDKLEWIIADIECAKKYLSIYEKQEFEELTQKISKEIKDEK